MYETFTASVQYNDFKGTVAADGHDSKPLFKYLEEQGLLKPNEHLIGISVYSGETFGNSKVTIGLNAYVSASSLTYDELEAALHGTPNDQLLRKIDLTITPDQFFAFFKRFEINMSKKNMMDGVKLAYHEETED